MLGCKTLSLTLRCNHSLAAIWFHVSGLLCTLGGAIAFYVLLDSLARQPGLRSLQFLANAFQRIPGLVFTAEMSNRCLCHALTIVLLLPVRQQQSDVRHCVPHKSCVLSTCSLTFDALDKPKENA